MNLEKLKLLGGNEFASFEPVSKRDIASFRKAFPDLPRDYTDFLHLVGCGNIRSRLMIYGGPTLPDDVFGGNESALADLILFGDNFAGICFAFQVSKSWRVVEVESDRTIRKRAKSFTKLLAKEVKKLGR